jgi:hypothetical protein
MMKSQFWLLAENIVLNTDKFAVQPIRQKYPQATPIAQSCAILFTNFPYTKLHRALNDRRKSRCCCIQSFMHQNLTQPSKRNFS